MELRVLQSVVLLVVVCLHAQAQKPNGCPADIFSIGSGVMTSPNWPANYPDRWDCTWSITVPQGQFVHLQFTEFGMENCSQCGCDFLEISDDKSGWTERYCGSKVPPLIISQSNSLSLRLFTDGSSTGSGFHAVYSAVRKPYDCPKNTIQAFAGSGIISVNVEVVPGITIDLSPGIHTVEMPSVNCTVTVLVNTATSPADNCPENVSTTANADTQLGVFSLSVGGFSYELTLPRGSYDYNYKLYDNNCSTKFIVFDNRLRRRLDLSAQYDIKCSSLQFAGSNTALISVAEQKYPEIERLCRGRCKKSTTEEVHTTCANDTTTITWPTDRVFGGDVQQVPVGFIDTSSSSGVRSKTILSVFLFTNVPRVVYPKPGIDGVTVQSHLVPFCTEKYIYDSVNEVCLPDP